jgi:hypothetical protein
MDAVEEARKCLEETIRPIHFLWESIEGAFHDTRGLVTSPHDKAAVSVWHASNFFGAISLPSNLILSRMLSRSL